MATKKKTLTRKNSNAKRVQSNLATIQEGFRRVLEDHGLENMHVTRFSLMEGPGGGKVVCRDVDGHVHCEPE